MPYLQAKSNNYFGFMPAGEVLSMGIYHVSSSATTGANAIHPGDVVCYSTLADATVVRVATGSASTDAGVFVGVSASYVPATGGSTSASLNTYSSQVVLVYDHPDQLFVGCDTTSGVIGKGSGIGKSFAIVSTGAIGSTGPNSTLLRSVQALSGVTASSGSANGYRFKVVRLHPIETALSTVAVATAASSDEVRKFIVVPALPVLNRRDTGQITT